MLSIVLIVCFVMVMFLWLLSLLGATPELQAKSSWFGWFACFFLGLWLSLYSTGILVVKATP